MKFHYRFMQLAALLGAAIAAFACTRDFAPEQADGPSVVRFHAVSIRRSTY